MSNDLNYMIRMKADVNGVLQGQSKVTAGQRVLNNVLTKTNATGKHAAQGISVATKANNMLAKSIQHAAHMAVGTFGLFQLQQAGAAALDTLGKYQDLRTRITGLTGSSQAYGQAQEYLVEVSRRHNKEILVIADSYSKLLALQKGGIITQTESKQILEGMSNAASHFGASSEQLKQSLFGMSQGLSSPILRAEELNQVVEPLPGLLQDLDKAAKLPAGGFRQMVVAGKVTADFFKSTLIKAFKSYEGAAAATSDNVNAKFAQLNTTYTLMVAAFEKPINSGLDTFFTGANSSMEVFTNNADTIIYIIGKAMTFALARASAAGINYGISLLANARNAAIARNEAIALAQAEVKQAFAQRTGTLIITERIAAEKALTVARANLATITQTTTLRQKGLNLAMSLIGGPAGIVTLAAFALYEFASSTENASEKSKFLISDLKALQENFKSLTELQLKGKIVDVTNAIKQQSEKVKAQSILVRELSQTTKDVWDPILHQKVTQSIEITKERRDQLTKALLAEQKATGVLNTQLALHLKLQNQLRFLAGGGKPQQNKTPLNTIPNKGINQIEQFLRSKEQRISASYIKRQQLLDNALKAKQISQTKYNNLSLLLELKKDTDLNAIIKEKAVKQASDKEKLRQDTDQSRRDNWDQEIAQLQGFHNRQEAEEQAHQDRLRDIRLRNAGQYGDVVRQFVQFDRASGADRLASGLQIAQGLTSINANESKKQFELNKKVSIANAMVSTFLAITNAYADLPYPVNIAASIAIGAMGLANVAKIRSQQFQGQAHDGIGRVMGRNEGTWVLKQDEMVLNPQQRDNFETLVNYAKQQETTPNQAAAYAGTTVNIQNTYQIDATGAQDGVETALEAALDEANRRMRQDLAEDFGNGGPLAQRLKGQAA